MRDGGQDGLTLVETLVAMAVLAITATAVFPILSIGAKLENRATATARTLNYARQQLEAKVADYQLPTPNEAQSLYSDESNGGTTDLRFSSASAPSGIDTTLSKFRLTAVPSSLAHVGSVALTSSLSTARVVAVTIRLSSGTTTTIGTIAAK